MSKNILEFGSSDSPPLYAEVLWLQNEYFPGEVDI